jgi:TRAP-type C4-dicarboxylate transport system permease small subunit
LTGTPPESGSDEADISDIRLVDVPALVFFWLLAVIVFLQFFTRYVLNDSLGWTEEVARYVLILVGFAGSVICVRKGTHIFLEFFYRYLSPAVAKAISIIVEIINLVFYGYMGWLAVLISQRTRQNMISVQVPRSLVYWIICLCLVAMAVYTAIRLVRRLRQRGDDIVAEIEAHALSDKSS